MAPMRILSGVQSSGKLHIGNYFGALRQFLDLQHKGEALFFIANHHALTTVRNADTMRANTRDVALDYLALGLDPTVATLFRQSDIHEIPELFWYLSAIAPMGLLERAHSYKDKVAQGIAPDVGLFTYPVLMAADILLYGSDVVPVGKDQMQHLEITRDIATKFNLAFVPKYDAADPDGKEKNHAPGILKLPTALVQENAATVPGVDNRKMSKSYDNTIDLFMPDGPLKKRIMGITTDSTPLEAPKEREGSALYALLKLFADHDQLREIDRTFAEGGLGWGHYKLQLLDLFHATFDEARKRREELAQDPGYVESVLTKGAERAREIAAPTMEAVRRAVGTR
jgi:tryptophanyl-tRNA synthetase